MSGRRESDGDAAAGAGTPAPAPGASDPEVPLQDPAREYAELRDELEEALLRVARSGRYVLGDAVREFEERVAGYVGVQHAIGVASGTDALILALRALGVGPGDEVVTSPFAFFALAEAILEVGARPVFADIRPSTYNLDPASVAEAVTGRTAVILPVHLFGQMADVPALRRISDEIGASLVEDAAQAFGAARRAGDGWLRAGAAGDAACFSFYPTKNLGACGEGGMVTTDDPALASRLRRLRNHGRTEEGRHAEVGRNSRLQELQAAVLGTKMEKLEEWNARRRAHAAAYDRAFAGPGGIEPPAVAGGNRHVYQQYTVRCVDRDGVASALGEAGVGCGIYYRRPLHLQEPLSALGYEEGDFPAAEEAAGEVLSLPVHPALRAEERTRVVEAVRSAL